LNSLNTKNGKHKHLVLHSLPKKRSALIKMAALSLDG